MKAWPPVSRLGLDLVWNLGTESQGDPVTCGPRPHGGSSLAAHSSYLPPLTKTPVWAVASLANAEALGFIFTRGMTQ